LTLLVLINLTGLAFGDHQERNLELDRLGKHRLWLDRITLLWFWLLFRSPQGFLSGISQESPFARMTIVSSFRKRVC
jgi:hypothetical protein